MGLDTSHDAWHGAYSSFGGWRREVAIAAGLIQKNETLFPKAYYDPDEMRDSPLDWDKLNKQTDCMGVWYEEPEDPIFYLINHSDCEGVIQFQHLLPLADRLEKLVPLVDNQDFHFTDWQESKTQRFVDGLRAAYDAGEDLDFH